MKTPPRLPLLQLLLWAANGPAAAVAAAPFASLMELMDQTKKVSSHQHELPQPNARPKGRRALTLQSPASQAERMLEFGDYAQYPDTCPFTTSCPAVCVADEADCPTSCPDGYQLCEWGNCMTDCNDETNVVENPCDCGDLIFACAKVVDIYENCFLRFGDPYYSTYTECVEQEEEEVPLVSFTGPWFVACYTILASVTAAVVLWCAYNTHIPVVDAVTTMTTPDDNGNGGVGWTLTGYKRHPVGVAIHALVIFVLVGIQFLLFFLTICYYMQQEAITRWGPPVFYDEVQVLMAFEIVWMVGLPWTFAFCYPSSIRDLFLRRCALADASFVAVEAPLKQMSEGSGGSAAAAPGTAATTNREWGAFAMGAFWAPVDFCLRSLFSYPHSRAGYETVFCPVTTDAVTGKRGLYFRLRRYVYAPSTKTSNGNAEEVDDSPDNCLMSFQQGKVDVGVTLGDFLNQAHGLTLEEARDRYGLSGPNSIPIKKPTVLGCILQEFSQPFYVYQNFMVWTWAPFWYYYMAIVNTFVRVTGGIVVGVFKYLSDSVLYKLSAVEGRSIVIRDGIEVDIANADIVAGDVVVLGSGVVCCDVAIVSADRLVVDESALTGEANPVVKGAIDPTLSNERYDPFRHKTFVLSAGTEMLEVTDGEKKNLGLVLSTGSFTSKGRLLSEVLAYQRHKFKFDDEVKLVLCILVMEAFVLVGLVFFFIEADQWVYAWFYAMFVVGTILPPLLPTVFVVSVGISARRLHKKRITCTNQEGILVAGKVNTAFFDKTGTLTKQGMDFISCDAETPYLEEKVKLGMAVCHTLHKASNGHLIGNHVESCAFEHTGAELSQVSGSSIIALNNQNYTVVKRYEFDTHRVTQSVVVESLDGQRAVYVKGSPEAIRNLCVSGVPSNFDESAQNAAKSGVYQLAMAFKDYGTDEDLCRDEVEKGLQFGGFMAFRNLMRENTPSVIRELKEGSVTVAMITGDNVLTGICIAREAGMIREGQKVSLARKTAEGGIVWTDADSEVPVASPSGKILSKEGNDVDLAITGEAWIAILQDDPKYAASIAPHVRVYGRCNPSDKVAVVAHFVEQGKKTLMCGDGGNDCGSLKSAHVGIALSTSEASVVAPFTSLDKDIASVPEVLREGRCALASAFAVYSYYIVWGQDESFLQVINAYFAITFTDWCWVFLDGVWSIGMAFTLPLSKAAKKLSATRPTASLLGPRTMFSVCGMVAWNFIFLVIALAVLWNEDWFQCRKWGSVDVSQINAIGDNYETTVLFVVGGYQYISSAVALNFGYTWRQHFVKNYVFVFLVIVLTTMHFIVVLNPSSYSCLWRVNCENQNALRLITTAYPVAINNPWNSTLMPAGFQWKLIGIMVGNVIVLCLWQYVFVNGFLSKKVASIKASHIAASDAALNVSTKEDHPTGRTESSDDDLISHEYKVLGESRT